jgi:RNA polymerase sigma-70 factor (ECF subfamily)
VTQSPSFAELIRGLRAGEQGAAANLVRLFEPAVRLAVRHRLSDDRVRRVVDSQDICQEVLASFFQHVTAGRFEIANSEQLLKILVTMARNKLIKEVQRQRAARRDNRRVAPGRPEEQSLAAAGSTPSKQIEAKDFVQAVQNRLTPDEWKLAELKGQGYEWPDIAAQLGGNPDALRMKLMRALKRVARQVTAT